MIAQALCRQKLAGAKVDDVYVDSEVMYIVFDNGTILSINNGWVLRSKEGM